MTKIAVKLSPRGIQEAIDRLDDWANGTLEPASDLFTGAYIAEEVRGQMLQDVHDERVNIGNTGGLRRKIESADVQRLGDSSYRMTVRADALTNPEKEMNWGNKMHGHTPPPHDFTRNINDVAEIAQQIWDEEIRSLL